MLERFEKRTETRGESADARSALCGRVGEDASEVGGGDVAPAAGSPGERRFGSTSARETTPFSNSKAKKADPRDLRFSRLEVVDADDPCRVRSGEALLPVVRDVGGCSRSVTTWPVSTLVGKGTVGHS